MKKGFKLESLIRRGNMLFSLGMIGIVFILVLPLPTWMIDALLSFSIALSVLIIMLISNIKKPTDFSVFPTLLLFVTLFRLGLNIATTRAILTQGDAGNLINAFGQFVVQGNFIIGLVIFIILTIINFIVITKGAGRVAEVSARFTLDAMPGKQMSIDADLNAGIISEREARDRRRAIEKEADFYGAMDGASKFVRGDAMAGVLITGINLIGGFVIGILQMGLSAEESVQRFSLLSVGDGLVAQIPALLISTAAGILVTRSGSEAGLGEDFMRQLFSSSRVVMMTGFMLWAMVLVPGFPKLVLIAMGGIFVTLSRLLPKSPEQASTSGGGAVLGGKTTTNAKDPTGKSGEPATFIPKPGEVLTLEIGLGLLPLVQGNMQNLLDRVLALRRTLSQEMGVTIPPITIRDQSALGAHRYQLLLRGHALAHGEVFCNQLMAMGLGKGQRTLRGRETIEPAFGMPAIWIPETERKEAERSGYVVIDPLTVMVTHLSEMLKRNLSEMMTRQDVQELLNRLKENNAAVVQELGQLQISVGLVQRILQNLLREGVSVRELSVILERLCDQYPYTKNVDELSEACRRALHLEINRQLDTDDGKLKVITLHPEVEQRVIESVRQNPQEVLLVLDPSLAGHIHAELKKGIQSMAGTGRAPTLLCAPAIRMGLKKFFEDSFRALKIFSYNEISPQLNLDPVYTIAPLKA
ncbi:MAG TPA: flagellar biosynthesis protein FlhA [Candidatus Methylacidiphilales bacterium]|nr:flagellar biosynthesis protein FlhA [Candidatus Methylacidiphilales bacterium]